MILDSILKVINIYRLPTSSGSTGKISLDSLDALTSSTPDVSHLQVRPQGSQGNQGSQVTKEPPQEEGDALGEREVVAVVDETQQKAEGEWVGKVLQ